MDLAQWSKMTASKQILNIGGEIQRALDRKNAGNMELADKYMNHALDLIRLSKLDRKNAHRIDEFTVVENELIDYFTINSYQNTDESLMSYWDSYLSACNL